MLGGTARVAGRHDAPRRDREVAGATAGSRWAMQWRGWAPWQLDATILFLAALTVVVDVASAWADISIGRLGRVPISPALPIALVLAARIGCGALGFSRAGVRAWREYAVAIGAVLVIAIAGYVSDVAGLGEAIGLVGAAAGEELVYRLALLVIVGAVTARACKREWRDPRQWGTAPGVVALLVGAMAFSALPGHVAQMRGFTSIAPFASLAIVLGWVVLRTGTLWPAMAAHAVLNLATITAFSVDAPAGLRLGLAGATLVALVIAADVAGHRTGRLRPVPSAIDLTAVQEGASTF
jgi:membrane protease YdiL (CAAX protease family)